MDFGDKLSGFEAIPNNIRFVMPIRGLRRAGWGKLGDSPVSACCYLSLPLWGLANHKVIESVIYPSVRQGAFITLYSNL